jgi:hypothetical protein
MLHGISNEVEAETRENRVSMIGFKDLTAIRVRPGASWGNKWAFNWLYGVVEH